jgi:ADP-heptose:LPS heptosyltransferase
MLYAARSILAIDMSPFGKSLTLLPAMRALRASYPNTQLVAAAPDGTCELLHASGFVDETISLGVIKAGDGGLGGALKKLAGLVRGARGYSFDLVLDFSPTVETQLVSRLILRARVFTPSNLSRVIGRLLNFGGDAPSGGESSRSDYTNVLQQTGVELIETRFGINPAAEEDGRFEHRLAGSGSRGGELIVLLYGSHLGGRRFWPIEAFGEVGTRLTNNFNARVVAADEPSDCTFTRAVSGLLPGGAIKLSEPRAMELIAAIARASIVVTDEPSIAQVASELSTPVIEIADTASPVAVTTSTTHRLARALSRSHVSAEEVFEIASEMIQENRSLSLFQRP